MHAKSALMSVKDVLPEISSKSILIILHKHSSELKGFWSRERSREILQNLLHMFMEKENPCGFFRFSF